MEKVYLTEPIHEKAVSLLEENYEVVVGSDIQPETIMAQAADSHAIITRIAKIPGEIISNAPQLKVIAKHGVGVDNIDLGVATQNGIQVVNAPEANINAVAEQTVGMIIALARNFTLLDGKMRQGDFESRNRVTGVELKGKTVGMIGFGRIAQLIAKKLGSFELNLIAYRRRPDYDIAKSFGVRMVDLEELYRESDFITVNVPLDQSTQNLINKDAILKMKKKPCLINVSRGGVVSEADLYDALVEGLLKGAATDVYEKEPPGRDNKLFTLENVLLTPHNAALTEEALLAMAMDAATGVIDALQGRRPRFLVNSEVMFTK